ncbi:kinase-like domain-containing protein, partial [Favolaschia claudopus]
AILVPRDYLTITPLPGLTQTKRSHDDPLVYIKRPPAILYEPNGKHTGGKYMLHESVICEVLMKHPHPNICEYFGYVASAVDGRMEGLCFQRYRQSLWDLIVGDGRDAPDVVPDAHYVVLKLTVQGVVEDIKRGIQHLHSLGYAHNDINPSNIMLSTQGQAVIIDFDSCRKVGESLLTGKAGSPDWSNGSVESDPASDFYGLEKIEEWLMTKTTEDEGSQGDSDELESDDGDESNEIEW